jgi:hypothetical protein
MPYAYEFVKSVESVAVFEGLNSYRSSWRR